MLLEGMRRTGFRPLRPEISASEPTAITNRATMRKASYPAALYDRHRAPLTALGWLPAPDPSMWGSQTHGKTWTALAADRQQFPA